MYSSTEAAYDAEQREWNAMTPEELDAWLAEQDAADDDAAEWERYERERLTPTPEEAAAEAAYYAAQMAEAERVYATAIAAEERRAAAWLDLNPAADPACKFCRGTGVVYDTVDYGSTTAQMESPCECATDYEWAVTDGDGIALEQGGDIYKGERLHGFFLLRMKPDSEILNCKQYPTAAALLDACATIAPLPRWTVLYDDQGADDAPMY